ncbi:response regulator, partial [uncultured Bacteroides sp.]
MRNKILLVEDTADLSLIISETLSECGYDVVAAYDGKDGLAKFIMEKPDIVVADVMMPKLDGFDMARKIRSISPNVPLLFLTAKSGI